MKWAVILPSDYPPPEVYRSAIPDYPQPGYTFYILKRGNFENWYWKREGKGYALYSRDPFVPNPSTSLNPHQPYNPVVNPEDKKDLSEQIQNIQNPDLKIIAQLLLEQHRKLDKLDKLDYIANTLEDIKALMESEVWNREKYLIASRRVKPKNFKVVLKPDLDNSRKYADVVYIYRKGKKEIARIVEAKSSPKIGDPESLKEKFRNTEEYVKRAGFKVDKYEWVLSVPEHIPVPEIKDVEVVKNPEVPYEDE